MASILECKTQFILLFMIIVMYASQITSRNLQDSSSMVEKHESWMARHGRTYEDDIEKAKRLNIFEKNVKFIESFNNNGTKSYKLGINEFADLTSEEFLRYYTTKHGLNDKFSSTKSQQLSPTTLSSLKYENLSDVPSDMDWRQSDVVTSIKDQGQCGKSQITIYSFTFFGFIFTCQILLLLSDGVRILIKGLQNFKK